ncbi:MAG TPA: hypothetical protein VNM47_19385 [Terriglobia bacterium]|nr:hypothetical protein [Terriglobia bacterium]
MVSGPNGSRVVRRLRLVRDRQRCRLAGLTLLPGLLVFFLTQAAQILGQTSGLAFFPYSSGTLGVYSTGGTLDTTSPFFQALGTNSRSCDTCHKASDGYSITPLHIQEQFDATKGTDPLFRPNDGSNCADSPGVDESPPAKSAYSLLLNKGLIRFSLPIPANSQFTATVVSDPYGCAANTDSSGQESLTVYRRVPPATNLRFLSNVMLDGRESLKSLNDPATFQSNLNFDLVHQALDATLGHEQATTPPTQEQLQEIVDFELGTYTAQQVDNDAGVLVAQGADGGPIRLSAVPYYPGINDSLGSDPTGATFDPDAFMLFSSWEHLMSRNPYTLARESIARGERIFNSAPMIIQDVKGLNDKLGTTTFVGTCSTCHDAPDSGGHSLPSFFDIGITDIPADNNDPLLAALATLNTPYLPVYALSCSTELGGPSDFTVETTDPGWAIVTGRCADIGKVKVPVIRGLAARPPYFQDGSADTLEQAVEFYNQRFQMGLTANELEDLVSFLKSL